jgi:uncharacterized membrane protein
MNQRSARLVVLLPLLVAAAPLAGEPVLVCRGHEPEWNLRVEGPSATLATLGSQGLVQTGFAGRLQELGWGRPPFFVYRGRAEASGPDLVAVITRETCLDTMADAAEGGGASEYTARVSLPGGEVRLGCCSLPQAPEPAAPAAAVAPERVADGELLPLVVDPVGVVDLQPEQVLHPRVAVEATAVGAHLHQPRPHRLRRHRDRDRPGALVDRRWRQRVTGQCRRDLLLGRAPVALPGRERRPPSDDRRHPDAGCHH